MMGLNRDRRQILESQITKKFLENKTNKIYTNDLVKKFIYNLKHCEDIKDKCFFYLKGGNAFSLLKGIDTSGDFDFQFVPNYSQYVNWASNFKSINENIFNTMKLSISEINRLRKPPDFKEKYFEVETFKNWITNSEIIMHPMALTNLTKTNRLNEYYFIGEKYGPLSFEEIINHEDYNANEKRINIDKKSSIKLMKYDDDSITTCGPTIYINYTIPGFILYRLVYCFQYEQNEKKMFLKSEIIDVSIPRPGSPEQFTFSDGFTTNFRMNDNFKVYIPGCGYHCYENINMLQEIELKVSQSIQKEEKRKERFKESVKRLVKTNTHLMLKTYVSEPYLDNTNKIIYGYFSLLISNMFLPMKRKMDHRIYNFLLHHSIHNVIDEYYRFKEEKIFFDSLVQFKLHPKNEAHITVREVYINLYKMLDKINIDDISINPPLDRLIMRKICPVPFIIITVDSPSYANIEKNRKDFIVRRIKNIFVLKLKIEYNKSILIVVKNSTLNMNTPRLSTILKYTAFESQRYVLSDPFFKNDHMIKGISDIEQSLQKLGSYQDMHTKLFALTAQELYDKLKIKSKTCALLDVFPELPDYYDDQNARSENLADEAAQHQFLSELVLYNLELLDGPTDKTIRFHAEIISTPQFLRSSPCFESIQKLRKLECCITEISEEEFVFTGSFCDLSNCDITFSALQLSVTKLSFSSGTTSNTFLTPRFMYDCKLTDDTILATVQQAGTNQFEISGNYQRGEHKSIDQLLDIFGLGDIHFKEALPPEISDALFKELALKEVTISIKNKEITSFSVDVGATHKLNLIEDKLSFLPSFFVSIYKFGGDSSVNFSASGELDIGGTLYDIYANPIFGEISFGLRKGSTLNLKAIGEKFFNTTALPELVFDNLYASVNYYTNKYKFELQAVDLLEFQVVSKKISIKSLALQVWYEMSSYAVTVSGKFDVCGFAFDLGGTYYGNNEYSFSACIANNIDINVSALLKDYLGCDCLLGDSFNFKIDQIVFCYHKRDKLSFDFGVRAEFCGSDQMLKKLFAVTADVKVTAGKETSGWGYKVQIACELLMGETQRLTCSYDYDSIGANRNEIKISYSPKTEGDAITVKDILKAIGMDEIDESWNFITEIGVTGATLNYDFVKKELSGNIKVTGGGSLEYSVQFGDRTKYSLKLSSTAVLKLSDVPIAGGLTDRYLSNGKDFTVKNLTVYALSEKDTQRNIPAGVRLELSVLGEQKSWQIYERSEAGQAQLAAAGTGPKVIWIKLDKTLAIFTLHRLGLGLDGSYLTLGLDASLNVSPLTFSLYGAGIGFNLSSHDLKYSLSGLGASFKSNVLTIDGAFRKDGGKYAGKLLIKVKPISIFAVAEYSETGSLFAYAVVSGRIGGLPEFFVTGLALGFGYNKQIRIPSIEKVADYPLIQGAKGDIVQDEILTRLDEVMKEENGQKFLAAGVKFSTYEIVDSFVLLLISFGNHFEIDILGISGVTMPPQCPEGISPIAHAQLALKASFKPADGFFGIEGRLTSESFILAKECHLKGGFAFYMWFGGEQSGDFVLTFGGYHPKYYATKPAHYPDVPGIGFEWKVNDNVNFCGEMYFALTPSAIMAGARLKATCDWGNFKAWFVAKADFIIAWKPFHYELEMGVIMGASYHVNTWLASFSVSVEIGTNLHIWGPDFSGTAYVDLGIVSFDVSFGAAAHKKPESLSWSAFCESFLPKAQAPTASLQNPAGSENKAAPLTISFGDGVNGEVTVGGKKIKSVQSGGLAMTVNSAVPIKTANVNRSGVSFTPVDVDVKPMGDNGRGLDSELLIIISGMQFEAEVVTKNMPTALWGGEGELRRNVPCGVLLKAQGKHDHEFIFPAVNVISLEDLYNKGTILINHAFVFLKPTTFPSYIGTGTVSVFSATVNTPSVATARETYLKSLGVILNKKIELTKYAAEAESYLDEEVLIPIS